LHILCFTYKTFLIHDSMVFVQNQIFLFVSEVISDLNLDPETESSQYAPQQPSRKCEAAAVTRFIQQYVLTAYLKQETRRELHYILPYEEARKGNFEKLFQVGHVYMASVYFVLKITCTLFYISNI